MCMYSCNATQPCCLRSSSEQVCSKRHDTHCMDCELFSHLFSLIANESATVFGDKETIQRMRDAHTKTSLLPWAKHHKVKNYCRLTHENLCVKQFSKGNWWRQLGKDKLESIAQAVNTQTVIGSRTCSRLCIRCRNKKPVTGRL